MKRERTKNTMLPWDDTFPKRVVHIASMSRPQSDWRWFEVVWYGAESTVEGSVPLVAHDPADPFDTDWVAGEGIIHRGQPVIAAVNGYGHELDALAYASDRKRIWTL